MAKFFDVTKPGKGVSREDVENRKGFALYIEIFFKRFWKLTLLNLLFLAASVPALLIAHYVATYAVSFYAEYAGIAANEEWLPALSQTSLFVTLIILQFAGSGAASAGLNYVLRKYVCDTHAWVWSDFIKSFGKNFWQATAIYIINIISYILLIGSFLFYSFIMNNAMSGFLRIVIIAATVYFSLMQMYVYQLLAGFELKIKDIYKNAAILVILRLPRNIGAMLASIGVMYILFNLAAISGMYAITWILLPLVLVFFYSAISYTQLFVTRTVIEKYMLNADDEEAPQTDFEDAEE